MQTFWQVMFGLVAVVIFGLGVKPLVDRAKSAAPLTPPNEAMREKWAVLTEGDTRGAILGNFERLFYFGALWTDASTIIAAWLAFKVASKWNAWTNVIAVPKTLPGIDDIDLLIARRRWGSHVLMTFLVGTLANLVVGFVGVVVGRHGLEFIQSVLC